MMGFGRLALAAARLSQRQAAVDQAVAAAAAAACVPANGAPLAPLHHHHRALAGACLHYSSSSSASSSGSSLGAAAAAASPIVDSGRAAARAFSGSAAPSSAAAAAAALEAADAAGAFATTTTLAGSSDAAAAAAAFESLLRDAARSPRAAAALAPKLLAAVRARTSSSGSTDSSGAAGLSPDEHFALLGALALGGRRADAAEWLAARVPAAALTWRHVAAVAWPAEAEGDVGALRRALAAADARGVQDPDLQLAGARLALAAADGGPAAVEAAWAAIEAGADGGARRSAALLARRVLALHETAKRAGAEAAHAPIMAAAHALLDAIEAEQRQQQLQEEEGLRIEASQRDDTAAAAAGAGDLFAIDPVVGSGSSSSGGSSSTTVLWQQQQQVQRSAPDAETASTTTAGRDAELRALDAAAAVAARALDAPGLAALLARRRAARLPPTVGAYRALLNLATWGPGGSPEAAEALLAEMLGFGLRPDARCYERLIDAHAHFGDGAAAAAVLDRMASAGFAPDSDTYRRLLHGLGSAGDLDRARAAYARLRAEGVPLTAALLGRAFRCARNFAQRARAEASRERAALAANDRPGRAAVRARRRARLNDAYSALLGWQADMVAAGLRHTGVTRAHLMGGLERVNAADDCVRLAALHEAARPGDLSAHRFALKVTGRLRTPTAAGQAAALGARLEARGGALSGAERAALAVSASWLSGDGDAAARALSALRRARSGRDGGRDGGRGGSKAGAAVAPPSGGADDPAAAHQLLHGLLAAGAWGDALSLVDELQAAADGAAGGAASSPSSVPSSSSGCNSSGGPARAFPDPALAPALQEASGPRRPGGAAARRFYPPPRAAEARPRWERAGDGGDGEGGDSQQQQQGKQQQHQGKQQQQQDHAHTQPKPLYGPRSDAFWHTILRALAGEGAPDGVVTAFAARMAPGQLRRFAALYGLRRAPGGGGGGWTVRRAGEGAWRKGSGGGGRAAGGGGARPALAGQQQ